MKLARTHVIQHVQHILSCQSQAVQYRTVPHCTEKLTHWGKRLKRTKYPI
jgi:hypothetical protein